MQENDTSTSVNAMKKILNTPLVASALLSNLFVHDDGNTSSNAPKNDTAKATSSPKNSILNTAFVDKSFSALAPKTAVISSPMSK
ncbi:hypothetical protein Barb7_02659 [Bacteroidales bacterium Barb7]|nr:hypothetical protein Barb7_02659 [Bacteroidales bacterium Barb7]